MTGARPAILMIVAACMTLAGSLSAAAQDTGAGAYPWLLLEDMTQTRDRPLFAPDRRAPAPPAPPAPVAAAPRAPAASVDLAPRFELKGIIVERDTTLVLLKQDDSPEMIVVRSGDTIAGRRVVADGSRSVRIVGDDEEVRLQLFEEN